MRILKRLNCQVIIIGVLAVAIVADAYLPREISGENTIGGCKKCWSQGTRTCASLEGRECTRIRSMCLGSGSATCYPQKEEPSALLLIKR